MRHAGKVVKHKVYTCACPPHSVQSRLHTTRARLTLRRLWQWGAAAALALSAVLLAAKFAPASREPVMEQRSAPLSVGTHANGPARQSAGEMQGARADAEFRSIGRDALRLWGAWDGLSPVLTQMMAQGHRDPSATATTPQGGRGRRHENLSKHTWLQRHSEGFRHKHHHHRQQVQYEKRDGAPFPYVFAVMSLHGSHEDLDEQEATEFKQALAKAVSLQSFGSKEMHEVFGVEATEWIEIVSQGPLNCTEAPHVCDDKGRRRRRLLSVDGAPQKLPWRRGRGGTSIRAKLLARKHSKQRLPAHLADAERFRAARRRAMAIRRELDINRVRVARQQEDEIKHELMDAERELPSSANILTHTQDAEGLGYDKHMEGTEGFHSGHPTWRKIPTPEVGYRVNSMGQRIFHHDYSYIGKEHVKPASEKTETPTASKETEAPSSSQTGHGEDPKSSGNRPVKPKSSSDKPKSRGGSAKPKSSSDQPKNDSGSAESPKNVTPESDRDGVKVLMPPGVGGIHTPPKGWPEDTPEPPWGYPTTEEPAQGWPRMPEKGWPRTPPRDWPGMIKTEKPGKCCGAARM